MNPRPYSADWQSLSESELLASYRNSAPVPAEERTRVPAEESDLAYAARLFERVAREIADEDFALAILAEWGIAPNESADAGGITAKPLHATHTATCGLGTAGVGPSPEHAADAGAESGRGSHAPEDGAGYLPAVLAGPSVGGTSSAGCGISPRSSISPAGSPPAAAGHFPSEAP